MTATDKNYFSDLNAVNVNDKTEEKNGLTYLSWAWAWAEFCKRQPDATYEIVKFNGLPYVYDENTGYMVYTRVTILGITREMWLPVMDGNNLAMKNTPYEVTTKWGKKITVKPATMFDINKTIMRCLTKNLAMFGLGLYIYAGEDLPEDSEETGETKKTSKATAKTQTAPAQAPTPVEQPTAPVEQQKKKPNEVRAEFVEYCKTYGIKDAKFTDICRHFKLNNDAPDENFKRALEYCKQLVEKARREAVVEARNKSTETSDALEDAENFLKGIEEV